MIRAIPFLASLAVAIVIFAGTGAQAAGDAQALGIVLHHDTAATERLPFYRSNAPITVNVHGGAARAQAMSVTAHGPDGSAVTAPLTPNANGFSGALALTQPGTWTLAVQTQFGMISAGLGEISLDVVPDDNLDLIARCAYALSALSIGVGLTLLVRGRHRPPAVRA